MQASEGKTAREKLALAARECGLGEPEEFDGLPSIAVTTDEMMRANKRAYAVYPSPLKLFSEIAARQRQLQIVLLRFYDLEAERNLLRDALEWYAEQAAGCRKLGSIGEPYRNALNADGGQIARAALSRSQEGA